MKIQKGINYWSYPGGLEGSLDLDDFLAWAKEDGYESVEFCIGDSGALHLGSTKAACVEMKKKAADLGLSTTTIASGLYWGNSLASESAADRQKAKDALARMIEMANWFEAKTLLTIPGAVDVFFLPDRQKQSYSEVWDLATKGLSEAVPIAEEFKVRMGIENVWNRFLLSPIEMRTFIDGFSSEWVGCYFDVGNVLAFGYPEDWIRILGPRIAAVHFKDYRKAVGTAEGFVDLLEGDVDFPAVMAALREIGYEGPVTAELIPGYKHYPRVRVQNASRAMDAILGGGA